MSERLKSSTPSSVPSKDSLRHTRTRVGVTHRPHKGHARWCVLNTPTGIRYVGVFSGGDQVAEPRTYTVTDGPPRLLRDKAKVAEDVRVTTALEENSSLLLNDALLRSLDHYFSTGSLDDLADIVEVVFGICAHRGFTRAELLELVQANRATMGGFDLRRVLMSEPPDANGALT